jgi:hypothetical protein
MANKIIKGKIEASERIEKYDDDGNKIYSYRLTVNREQFTFTLTDDPGVYFDEQQDLVLLVNEKNVAVAGIYPRTDYSWGDTSAISQEVKDSDRFELATGTVLEKRKEKFNLSRGTFASPSYYSQFKNVTTYTIVLPDKTFRVHETIGKQVKPGTEIAALLHNDVAYIVKDKTNDKIFGKPRTDYLIALFLWFAFNCTMAYMAFTGQKAVFTSFTMVLVIGNLTFGIAFLISFTGFLSASKTLKIFKQMLGENR